MKRIGLVFALIGILASRAGAYTLDWDAITWAAGQLSNSFTLGGSTGVTATVVFTGFTNNLIGWGTVSDSPDDSFQVDGGTGEEALYFALENTSRTQYVTVTISFSEPVYVGGISIFDIDTFNNNSFQDQIRDIRATAGTNIYYPTLAVSNSSYVTISGSGTSNAMLTAVLNAGGSAGAGNLTSLGTGVLIFTNAISSLRFSYGDGVGAIANPTSQHVALGDFTFVEVPEPGTLAALALAAGVLFCLRRRARM